MTLEEEFHAYQRRITEQPDTIDFFVPLPNRQSPEKIIQYHFAGKDTYGAVYDSQKNFRSYIPKVEFN